MIIDKLKKLNFNNYNDLIINVQKLNLLGEYKEVSDIYNYLYVDIPNEEKKIKNILLNEYEIANKSIFLKSYPRVAQVFITNKCNLRCFMCDKNNHNCDYEISDKYLDFLLEIIPYLQKIFLRGGEVFYSTKSNIIIDACIKENVNIEIITNGLLLNELTLSKFIENNVELIFSIDSQNEVTYDSIRGYGNYNKLISILNLLKKLTKKYSNYKYSLNMVVMKRNYKEIESMLLFAHKYGFSRVTLNSIAGNFTDNIFEKTNEENKKIIMELNEKRQYFLDLANNYGIELFNRIDDINAVDLKTSNKCNGSNIIDDKKIFCLSPFRECFFSKNVFYPHVECDKKIDDTGFKNFFDFWNSDIMLEYREKILMANNIVFAQINV